MCSITKRPLLAQPATTQTDRRLARQVPLFTISILQDDVTLYAQRAIGPHRYMNCFFRHVELPPWSFQHSSGNTVIYWTNLASNRI
jgi:hypothetical protein